MPSFYRPCLQCGRLGRGTRCEQHETEYRLKREAQRNTAERKEKKNNLYGWEYQKQRKLIQATATHCHICGKEFVDRKEIEADHLVAGEKNSPLAAAHRLCNQRRGDKPVNNY